MAMRGLVSSLRLPLLVQQHMPVAGPLAAALAGQQHRQIHAGRLTNPWEEVLRVAKSNPEKLHEVVNTLTNHCIKAQAAPPLDTYNELLRICEMHSDLASVHKLCQMACAVRMHLDHTTFDRLQSVYSYFPKPFSSTAATGSFAGKDGLGPSTTQHAVSSTDEAASSSPAGRSVRTGAILEAPPTSSIPSVSATGGASSVSLSSSVSSFGANKAGVKLSTAQTNVWAASTGVTSTQSEAWRREREQASSSSSGNSGTTVNAPDAAA